MIRRLAAVLAMLAVVVGACSSAAPALTDPKEILSKSVLALKDAKTIHLQVDVSGKFTANLTGSGGTGQLDLAGTTATIDADIAARKAKVTALAPAFLNSGAELIATGDSIYYKITGPFAQTNKYTRLPVSDLPTSSAAPGAASPSISPQQLIDQLNEALGKLPSPPTRAADEKCGDADCYHIVIHVSAEDLAKLSSPAPLPSNGTVDVAVDVWVRKSDLRPAKISVTVNGGAQGNVTIAIAATYDAPVTIDVPPADQVIEGSALPFSVPSIAP